MVGSRVPPAAFVFMLMLAIVTHSFVDVARRAFDSLFFQRDIRILRANLRELAGQAGESGTLEEKLELALHALGRSVRATFGLIYVLEPQGPRVAATYRLPAPAVPMPASALACDDVSPLAPGQLPPPLSEAALLVPLYAGASQLGTLLLGQPSNGTGFSAADIDLLPDPSDRLAGLIRATRREADHLAQIARLMETSAEDGDANPSTTARLSIKLVENAFQHISDVSRLGEHSLANLGVVRRRLTGTTATHLDLGRALYGLLTEATERLRPAAARPGDPPAREWHAYIILHDAYLEDVPNRDIMLRLDLSEGTFNRTRRGALRAVARWLEEMEAAVA